MAKKITSAAQLDATAFVAAYNNTALTNQQVIDTLNVDSWDVIRNKTRGESVKAMLTVTRVGGASGSVKGAAAPTAATTTAAPTAAPTAAAATTTTTAPTLSAQTAEAEDTFSITIKSSGISKTLTGPSKSDVATQLISYLSSLSYKNVAVKDDSNAPLTDLAQLQNNGNYTVRDTQRGASK